MGKQQEKKLTATADKFFVFGIDNNGKPRGARFAEFNEKALNFVTELKLTGVFPASPAFTEIAAKLPPGRLYSSGKAFIPNIRRDLVEKLETALAAPGDESQKFRPAQDAANDESTGEPKTRTISPITFGLPQSWESVQPGHVVLVHESPTDGWWESTVLVREDEILTLRFRDYPRQPTFQRHISQVALINPGPNAT
jgi:hypothetical protein